MKNLTALLKISIELENLKRENRAADPVKKLRELQERYTRAQIVELDPKSKAVLFI